MQNFDLKMEKFIIFHQCLIMFMYKMWTHIYCETAIRSHLVSVEVTLFLTLIDLWSLF